MPIPGEYIIFGAIVVALIALVLVTEIIRRRSAVPRGSKTMASAALSSVLNGNVAATSIAVVASAKADDSAPRS